MQRLSHPTPPEPGEEALNAEFNARHRGEAKGWTAQRSAHIASTGSSFPLCGRQNRCWAYRVGQRCLVVAKRAPEACDEVGSPVAARERQRRIVKHLHAGFA